MLFMMEVFRMRIAWFPASRKIFHGLQLLLIIHSVLTCRSSHNRTRQSAPGLLDQFSFKKSLFHPILHHVFHSTFSLIPFSLIISTPQYFSPRTLSDKKPMLFNLPALFSLTFFTNTFGQVVLVRLILALNIGRFKKINVKKHTSDSTTSLQC